MVALTLLGVGMVRSTTSEERISSNSRDRDIAFAAAEAALRDAEIRIHGSYPGATGPLALLSFPPLGSCSNGLCAFALPPTNTTPIYQNTTYTFANSASKLGYLTGSPQIDIQNLTTSSSNTSVQQPVYFIEIVTGGPKWGGTTGDYFRVTALGYGARSSTQVMLQEGVLAP
jgi:type IV pilus assembly protein PilX